MRNRAKLLEMLKVLQPFTQMGLLTGAEASLITTDASRGDYSLLKAFLEQLVKKGVPDYMYPVIENAFNFIREE